MFNAYTGDSLGEGSLKFYPKSKNLCFWLNYYSYMISFKYEKCLDDNGEYDPLHPVTMYKHKY